MTETLDFQPLDRSKLDLRYVSLKTRGGIIAMRKMLVDPKDAMDATGWPENALILYKEGQWGCYKLISKIPYQEYFLADTRGVWLTGLHQLSHLDLHTGRLITTPSVFYYTNIVSSGQDTVWAVRSTAPIIDECVVENDEIKRVRSIHIGGNGKIREISYSDTHGKFAATYADNESENTLLYLVDISGKSEPVDLPTQGDVILRPPFWIIFDKNNRVVHYTTEPNSKWRTFDMTSLYSTIRDGGSRVCAYATNESLFLSLELIQRHDNHIALACLDRDGRSTKVFKYTGDFNTIVADDTFLLIPSGPLHSENASLLAYSHDQGEFVERSYESALSLLEKTATSNEDRRRHETPCQIVSWVKPKEDMATYTTQLVRVNDPVHGIAAASSSNDGNIFAVHKYPSPAISLLNSFTQQWESYYPEYVTDLYHGCNLLLDCTSLIWTSGINSGYIAVTDLARRTARLFACSMADMLIAVNRDTALIYNFVSAALMEAVYENNRLIKRRILRANINKGKPFAAKPAPDGGWWVLSRINLSTHSKYHISHIPATGLDSYDVFTAYTPIHLFGASGAESEFVIYNPEHGTLIREQEPKDNLWDWEMIKLNGLSGISTNGKRLTGYVRIGEQCFITLVANRAYSYLVRVSKQQESELISAFNGYVKLAKSQDHLFLWSENPITSIKRRNIQAAPKNDGHLFYSASFGKLARAPLCASLPRFYRNRQILSERLSPSGYVPGQYGS